eukprot:TRINITY_DN3913_c0_g1_i1.p1 TRINITY_DN3913_c0_g1~~TRINITY_DN3913_c0_g1_i1.p1  ORF type:complete len:306 (+),score=70.83 TRINITY_DN3913_c0_g1_i1:45-920(+)
MSFLRFYSIKSDREIPSESLITETNNNMYYYIHHFLTLETEQVPTDALNENIIPLVLQGKSTIYSPQMFMISKPNQTNMSFLRFYSIKSDREIPSESLITETNNNMYYYIHHFLTLETEQVPTDALNENIIPLVLQGKSTIYSPQMFMIGGGNVDDIVYYKLEIRLLPCDLEKGIFVYLYNYEYTQECIKKCYSTLRIGYFTESESVIHFDTELIFNMHQGENGWTHPGKFSELGFDHFFWNSECPCSFDDKFEFSMENFTRDHLGDRVRAAEPESKDHDSLKQQPEFWPN